MYLEELQQLNLVRGMRMTHSRCLCNFFRVEYSSLSSPPIPSKESIFGIELNGACFLCGATTLAEFSTATALMVDTGVMYIEIGCSALFAQL